MKTSDILAVLQVSTNTIFFHVGMGIALFAFKKPACESLNDVHGAVLEFQVDKFIIMHFTIFALQLIEFLSEVYLGKRFTTLNTFNKYCETFSQKLMEKAIDPATGKFPEDEENLLNYCQKAFKDAEGYKVTIDGDKNDVIIKKGEEGKTHAECLADL